MKILKKGILTTIQDFGRPNYQSIGINPSGAMDELSLRVLNLILQNNEYEAAIEFHFPSPIIAFEEDCFFALTGADFQAKLNQDSINVNKVYEAKIGDILTFKAKNVGERAYFGVKGGFKLSSWLESSSTNLHLNLFELDNNCSIEIKEKFVQYNLPKIGVANRNIHIQDDVIRFVSGNDFEKLDTKSQSLIIVSEFEVSLDSNRMGYKLISKPIFLEKSEEKISSAVTKGVIQLLPNGQLIVLMADAQVSGGYPNLGFVISNDLSKMSQLGAGKRFKFERVSIEFAIELKKKTDLMFENIKKSIIYAETQD